jgi:hypothetical protein
MNNFLENSSINDKYLNMDKNILIDALKHTSEIMTALSSKVTILEEEIKTINKSLNKVIISNQELKELYNNMVDNSKNNNSFVKLHEINTNINKVYKTDQTQIKINEIKKNIEGYVIKNGIEQINNPIDINLNNHKIEKLDEEGNPIIYPVHNLVSNRRRNNLFIRKI